jgi:dTMP kinase
MSRGALIVIEGIDAAGKATQARMLSNHYIANHRLNRVISFPQYESPTGKAILRHLKGEEVQSDLVFQCLMAADKYAAAPSIRSYIAAGHAVILDRYWQSAHAYNALEEIDAGIFSIYDSLPPANINVLIDVDPDIALKRRPPRDKFEENREFQHQVRNRYLKLWEKKGWPVVDGSKPEDEVAEMVKVFTRHL